MQEKLFKKLSTVINHIIATDDHSLNKLNQLQGNTFSIVVTDMSLTIGIRIMERGIQFEPDTDTVDVAIQGNALSMLSLLASHHKKSSFPKDITLRGDIHSAQQFQQLARELEVDWEELLSQVMGDIAAHQAGRFFKASRNAVKHLFHSFTTNSSEYLRYESEIVPDQGLIEGYRQDIDTLRDDAERLKHRVERLQHVLHNQG